MGISQNVRQGRPGVALETGSSPTLSVALGLVPPGSLPWSPRLQLPAQTQKQDSSSCRLGRGRVGSQSGFQVVVLFICSWLPLRDPVTTMRDGK